MGDIGREDAVRWCAENLVTWPYIKTTNMEKRPQGWEWHHRSEGWVLAFRTCNKITIRKADWESVLPKPAPLPRPDAINWCVQNLTTWPDENHYDTLSPMVAPGGWSWIFEAATLKGLKRWVLQSDPLSTITESDWELNLQNPSFPQESTQTALEWCCKNLTAWPSAINDQPEPPKYWVWQKYWEGGTLVVRLAHGHFKSKWVSEQMWKDANTRLPPPWPSFIGAKTFQGEVVYISDEQYVVEYDNKLTVYNLNDLQTVKTKYQNLAGLLCATATTDNIMGGNLYDTTAAILERLEKEGTITIKE